MTHADDVRHRPGMYVGDTDGSGLHHLLWEVVGNVIDQHLMRRATELHVDLADSWITVRDDGPGIPVDILEEVFTESHGSPTYDNHFPHVHVGGDMRGIGVDPVNALSERLEVETVRNGIRWAQAYERGRPLSPLTRIGPSALEGTTVRFRPDPTIFGSTTLDEALVRDRLQQLAWLNPLLQLSFQGTRLPGRGGITEWVRRLAAPHGGIEAIYSTCQHVDNVAVDLAIGWCAAQATAIWPFVNMLATASGTHVEGLWQGMTAWTHELGASAGATTQGTLSQGLIAVLHVGLHDPSWGAPTKDHLTSPVAATAVCQALENDVTVFRRHPQLRAYLAARLQR